STAFEFLSIVLYHTTYSLMLPLRLLYSVCIFIWSIIQFVLLPITYALQGIYIIASIPFRLQLLERLETLYIYLGIAALIGCGTGALLFLVFNSLSSALMIGSVAEAQITQKESIVTRYRSRERRAKQPILTSALHTQPAPKGMFSTAFAEDDHSIF
ncbi:hypothetical protein M011DRAFT_384810, partial [Sporormia fimetaria CBS 119925]